MFFLISTIFALHDYITTLLCSRPAGVPLRTPFLTSFMQISVSQPLIISTFSAQCTCTFNRNMCLSGVKCPAIKLTVNAYKHLQLMLVGVLNQLKRTRYLQDATNPELHYSQKCSLLVKDGRKNSSTVQPNFLHVVAVQFPEGLYTKVVYFTNMLTSAC